VCAASPHTLKLRFFFNFRIDTNDIPAHADKTYKDHGWKGWGDWLHTGRIVTSSYGHRPFEEARAFARSLGLKNFLEWLESNIPDAPVQAIKP
jgi:hypothetical protein